MRSISVLYGKGTKTLQVPNGLDCQIIEPKEDPEAKDPALILHDALSKPIGQADILELTQHARKVLLIANDNTRPVTSRFTIPALIQSFYHPEDHYDITILIATGLHRMMSDEELEAQLGNEIVSKHKVVVHQASDLSSLRSFGLLPSGKELFLNRLAGECDLIISEGFIEPHFYAGFSGGRKSIHPGIAGIDNILELHSPQIIAHPDTRQGNLSGNPVHRESIQAARMTKLRFILNVALGRDKQIIAAFAGDPEEAHLAGCRFVEEQMTVKAKQTDIVLTSNNGYPLDRNLYQAIKGIDTATKVARKGGVIIMAAECIDGIGHDHMKDLILSCRSVEELHAKMFSPPSVIDKWMAQVLARALVDHTIILVSSGISKQDMESMFFTYAEDLDDALAQALSLMGENASLSVIPEGPIVIPNVE